MNRKRMGTLAAVVVLCGGSAWADEVDMLTKIHTVFKGKPPQQKIQSLLDEVVSEYGMPPDNDSYEEIASVALTLRKDTAVPEMDVLRCAAQLRRGENALLLDFPQAAALCVTSMVEAPPTHAQLLQLQARIAALEEENAGLTAQLATDDELSPAPTPTPTVASSDMPVDSPVAASIPDEIEQQIRIYAAKRYADNISMQEAVMKCQRKAYLALQAMTAPEGVPDEVFATIKAGAAENSPESFTMQEEAIKSQCTAYLAIQVMTPPEGVPDEIFAEIKAGALKDYPDSFSMQESVIKSQCKAYLKLKSQQ